MQVFYTNDSKFFNTNDSKFFNTNVSKFFNTNYHELPRITTNYPRIEHAKNVIISRSVPGVGCITAMTLLVEAMDINRFGSQKKWRSYLGLVPVMEKSDETEVVGEKTFRGNKHLGPLIIEAAWVAIKKDAELAATYGRHCRHGMKPQEAIVRVAADLAARIYAVLKQDKKYVCK